MSILEFVLWTLAGVVGCRITRQLQRIRRRLNDLHTINENLKGVHTNVLLLCHDLVNRSEQKRNDVPTTYNKTEVDTLLQPMDETDT